MSFWGTFKTPHSLFDGIRMPANGFISSHANAINDHIFHD